MPSCPDCGVVYDSMYSVQAHRRSGLCRVVPQAQTQSPQHSVSSAPIASGGLGLPPINDPYYRHLAQGDVLGPGAVPLNAVDKDLESFLALQRAQQAEEMARRERQLLDQQVNLVLPTRQAQLQQTQDQLRNQLMQLKLNLLTQQQTQHQGANMDMEYVKNELAAVRNTITSLQIPGSPPYGAISPAASSWPLQGNSRAAAMMAMAKPAPPRKDKRLTHHRSLPAGRRSERGRSTADGGKRRAHTANYHSRRNRYDDDDDRSEDSQDDSEGSSDEETDDEDYSDEDDDHDDDGAHRRRRLRERRTSRASRKSKARGASPPAVSAGRTPRSPAKSYDDHRSSAARHHPRSRRPTSSSAGKRSDVFSGDRSSPPSLADQLKGMMQAMREEIQTLKASGNVAPPFPTASTLPAGPHTLQLGSLEGLDLSIPLDELEVSLKTYYMFNNSGEFVLEPAGEKVFARNPPPLMRASTRLLLFSVPPMDFTVNKPNDINVFVLQIKYRGRLLYWGTIFAKSEGAWTEGVRTGAFDLAAALQSTEDMIPGATVTGTIQAAESVDVLADAERLLRRASNVSTNGQRPSLTSGGGTVSPGDPRRGTSASMAKDAADAVAAVAARNKLTPSLTPSDVPESAKSLSGLPELDPVPKGLPVLPGMPGNEGPFLPPTATAHMMKQKGPCKHFALPPPPGTSILEWRDRFAKRAEKLNAKPSRPEQANSSSGGGGGRDGRGGSTSATSTGRRRGDSGGEKISPATASPANLSLSMPPRVGEVDFGNQVRSDGSDDSRSSSSSHERSAPGAPPPQQQQPAAPPQPPTSPLNRSETKEPEERKVRIMTETPKSAENREDSTAASAKTTSDANAGNGESILNSSTRQTKPQPLCPNATATPAPPPPPAPPQQPASAAPPPIVPSKTAGQPPQPAQPAQSASPSGSRRVSGPAPAQRQLLPINDNAGNLVVPPGYKNTAAPPISGVEQFDAKTAVNACVVIGLAKPTDKPPQSMRHCGHGEKGNEVDLFLDGVVGVPLHAVCTRLVVYITDEIDPKTGNVMNPLRNPRVFMRKPDLVAYQALDSSNVEPEFTAKLSTLVGEGTHAVVIVEYVLAAEDNPPITLGHCCLPINKRFFAGNFLSRIKLGDPRRTQERMVDDVRPADRIADEQRRLLEKYTQWQMEASVDAQALRNLMPMPPKRRAECVPMGYLIWRVDNAMQNQPYFEMPGQLPPSKQEIDVFNARVGVGDKPPLTAGIKSAKDAENRFIGGAVGLSDNIGYLAPYSPQRGCFLRVEGVRGLGGDNAFHVVVVRVPMGPAGRNVSWTRFPNWDSDVGAPSWVDPPFVIAGMPHNVLSCAVFTLLKITHGPAGPDGPYKCTQVAWTIAKLFLDAPGIMRQGTFILPWLAGKPPDTFLQQLAKEKMDKLFLAGLSNKSITFLQPFATMRLTQGDACIVPQLVEDTPGRPAARTLLMPAQMKNNFPLATNQGVSGRTLRQVHETAFGGGAPKATLEKMGAAVTAYLSSSTRE